MLNHWVWLWLHSDARRNLLKSLPISLHHTRLLFLSRVNLALSFTEGSSRSSLFHGSRARLCVLLRLPFVVQGLLWARYLVRCAHYHCIDTSIIALLYRCSDLLWRVCHVCCPRLLVFNFHWFWRFALPLPGDKWDCSLAVTVLMLFVFWGMGFWFFHWAPLKFRCLDMNYIFVRVNCLNLMTPVSQTCLERWYFLALSLPLGNIHDLRWLHWIYRRIDAHQWHAFLLELSLGTIFLFNLYNICFGIALVGVSIERGIIDFINGLNVLFMVRWRSDPIEFRVWLLWSIRRLTPVSAGLLEFS